MSVLTSFLAHKLLAALEAELVNHAPEIQEEFINEIQKLSGVVTEWVKRKLGTPHSSTSGAGAS